ncbi:hypothetical protein B0H13DRAFT_2226243 [Mycena leptocephala]|nr:hypothetical protein B0H13DRAFT_2226243 [Mycena leptocephala]
MPAQRPKPAPAALRFWILKTRLLCKGLPGRLSFTLADSNLPYDKFMWTLHTKTPEHWVPISTVASFKRMRDFSSLGNQWHTIEVDSEGVHVRRTTEVQEPKDQFERSVYAVKRLPPGERNLQARLEAFFEQYGPTNAVRMRRDGDKNSKCLSVFAEFTSHATALAFVSADPAPISRALRSWSCPRRTMRHEIREKGLSGKAADTRKICIPRALYGKHDSYSAGEGGVGENPLKEKFGRPPFIKHGRGHPGALSEEEIQFVRTHCPSSVTMKLRGVLPEDEEKQFQIERARSARDPVVLVAAGGRGGGRGGRGGGGRGGRDRDGGRGGGRGRGGRGGGEGEEVVGTEGKDGGAEAGGDDAATGEKRKRAVEPTGPRCRSTRQGYLAM